MQATCTLAANDSASDESIKKPRNSTTNGVANDSAVPYCAKNTAFTPEFGMYQGDYFCFLGKFVLFNWC